jgi:hypothetical protein
MGRRVVNKLGDAIMPDETIEARRELLLPGERQELQANKVVKMDRDKRRRIERVLVKQYGLHSMSPISSAIYRAHGAKGIRWPITNQSIDFSRRLHHRYGTASG